MTEDLRLHAPAALRNRDLIADILATVLPATGYFLEIASGSGEHCIRFAERFPGATIQPSDPEPRSRASIDAWVNALGLTNVKPALTIDASLPDWPTGPVDAIVCINMIHISPWQATVGLFRGAAKYLAPGGVLYTYGPYMRGGAHTSEGNAAFDASLRNDNPDHGIRSLEAITDLAHQSGLTAPRVIEMPSNNLSLIFNREA